MGETEEEMVVFDFLDGASIFSDFVECEKEPLPEKIVIRTWGAGDLIPDVDEVRIPYQGVVPVEIKHGGFCPGADDCIVVHSTGDIKSHEEKDVIDGIYEFGEYLEELIDEYGSSLE